MNAGRCLARLDLVRMITMANETNEIFTKKAADKLRSPDDLDEYVRITNPSIWIVLSGCAVLLIGLFAWGFFGTAETRAGATGTCVKAKYSVFCRQTKFPAFTRETLPT